MNKSRKTTVEKGKKDKSENHTDWFSFLGTLYTTDTVESELQSKDLFAYALRAGVPIPTLLRHMKRLESIELLLRRVQISDLTVYYQLDIYQYFLLSSLEFKESLDSDTLNIGFFSSGMEIITHLFKSLFFQATQEHDILSKRAHVEIYTDYVLKPALLKIITASPRRLVGDNSPENTAIAPKEHLAIITPEGHREEKRKYRIAYTVWWTLKHNKKFLKTWKQDEQSFISEVCSWFKHFQTVKESEIQASEFDDVLAFARMLKM